MIYQIIFAVLLVPTVYVIRKIIHISPLFLNLIRNEEIKQEELEKLKVEHLTRFREQLCSYNNHEMYNFRNSEQIYDNITELSREEQLLSNIQIKENWEKYDAINKDKELDIYKDFISQQEENKEKKNILSNDLRVCPPLLYEALLNAHVIKSKNHHKYTDT